MFDYVTKMLSIIKGLRCISYAFFESAKTGLICKSNYTCSMNHKFSCKFVNNTKFASFKVSCLVSLVSNLYTYSLPTE